MVLSDFTAKPAQMRRLQACEAESLAQVDLREGKYHQVKRMFAACGHPLTSLSRIRIGCVRLDPDLAEGE